MAETFGTLDDMLGPDPAQAANSGSGYVAAGPGQTPNASAGTLGAGLDELSRLRGLSDRHRQQINGAKQEVTRVQQQLSERERELQETRQALQELQNLRVELAELKGREQARQQYDFTAPVHPSDRQTPTQPTISRPPSQWVQAQRDILGYDVDEDKLAELWQAQQAAGVLTEQRMQQILQERERAQSQQSSVGQLLQQHYPELSNPSDPFTLRTMENYQRMASDPAVAAVFGNGMTVTDPSSGTQFNAAIVMQAAAQTRQEFSQGQSRQHAPTLPQGQAPWVPRTAPRDVISQGMADLLKSPELIAHASRAGLGNTPREIWGRVSKGVPESRRAQWEQESNNISYTRT